MCGEVFFSKLRIVHIVLVREELFFHGLKFEQEWSIKKLVQCLKEGDIASQKIVIKGKTGNTHPKESKLKTKSFLPLCCPAEAYKIDQIIGGGDGGSNYERILNCNVGGIVGGGDGKN